jgi:hypothetical protein
MPLICKIQSPEPELVLLIIGTDNVDINDINSFSTFLLSFLHGNIPFKLFFDLRNANGSQFNALQSLISKMNEFEPLVVGKIIATSVLVGPLVEGVLNTIFFFKKPLTPTKITSDINVACNYLNDF